MEHNQGLQQSGDVSKHDRPFGAREVDDQVGEHKVSICPVAHQSEDQEWNSANGEL